MSATISTPGLLKGGEWIIKESQAENVYAPEDFSERAKNDYGNVYFVCKNRSLTNN